MRVLIAEDDVTSRTFLEAVLKKWQYETVSCSDGNEAWAALQLPDAPQLAILDWMMPGMDGVEVCRRLRGRPAGEERYVYVILLTSKTSKHDTVRGIEAGADDYIAKPFDPQELQVRLRAGQRIIELQSQLLVTREALRVQATHDVLTGLLNRRAILDRLEVELSRGRREGRSLSLGMLDLDRFKDVNDTRGHQIGDVVLAESARRIQAVLREYDSVGRYGGEEFLAIVPGTTRATYPGVFERIRAAIADRAMPVPGERLSITASLGVAVSDETSTADELIRAADKALYQAKDKGRNCIELASDDKAALP